MNHICPAWLSCEGKPCEHYLKPGLCLHPSFFRCIEYIAKFEPILSYSSMSQMYCHRLFYHSYIQGLEAIDKPMPMKLGSACSEILDKLHSKSINLEKVKVHDLYDFSNWKKDDSGNYDVRLLALLSVLQAYVDLGKHAEKGKTQAEFRYNEPEMPQIHGFIDCLEYEDHIAFEFKYTQQPDSYSKFTVSDQLMTYFLAHKRVQRFTVRTILNPAGTIKLGKHEQVEVYTQRVYMDALARPNHYFKDTSYWRNEFDLVEYKAKIKSIARDITRLIEEGHGDINAFRKQNSPHTCYLMSNRSGGPSPCEYLKICETGVVSESLYRRRGDQAVEREDKTVSNE